MPPVAWITLALNINIIPAREAFLVDANHPPPSPTRWIQAKLFVAGGRLVFFLVKQFEVRRRSGRGTPKRAHRSMAQSVEGTPDRFLVCRARGRVSVRQVQSCFSPRDAFT